jgi:thiol-disulfide isomerase/thioredoxin
MNTVSERVAGGLLATALLVTVPLAAGCGREAAPGRPASPAAAAPFAGCAALSMPPPQGRPGDASSSIAPGGAPAAPRPLPAVRLPCYTGGAEFELTALRGPAVVNLWASWCEPCRTELPVLQRYADRVGGQAYVVGVVTEDTRAASTGLADDLGLRFPALYDESGQLRRNLNLVGLPITLFVDGAGQIRKLYHAEALDAATLDLLAEQYLGVVAP